MNKVMLVGRLTRDPELRSLPSGKHVATYMFADYRRAYEITTPRPWPSRRLAHRDTRQSLGMGQGPGSRTTATSPYRSYEAWPILPPICAAPLSTPIRRATSAAGSQRATVRRLAEADGHNGDLVEYDDWGVSADVAKSAKRTEYARLLADMEAGRVSAVYAFDVDRLYRDPRDLIRLQDAAQRHAVRIVTTSGALAIGDGDDPAAEAFAFIGSVFGSMELKKIKKRSRAARDARIARGDVLGRAPYGYKRGETPRGASSMPEIPSSRSSQ